MRAFSTAGPRAGRPGLSLRLALAAALALGAGCSSASAQEDHETWRCDTDNGTYSANPLMIWDKTTSISGRISFHKAYFGPRWSSTAKIGFTDSKLADGNCHCNGIFVKAFSDDPNGVRYYMLVDGEVVQLNWGRKYDTPITFRISIDPQGVMTIRIGKEHLEIKTAALPHPQRDTLMMECSGADVSFFNVDPQ
jgi:hypothetical protein